MWAQNHLPLQPSLQVNAPGDTYEQEADRVAKQVMAMPESQRQGTGCVCGQSLGANGRCAACGQNVLDMQRRASDHVPQTTALPIVHQVLQQPGQPLESATRHFMEARFGQDFSHVRTHTGTQASASARVVHARAYTVGQHMVFANGAYAPSSRAGRALLAHELTHTIQQANRAPETAQREVLDDFSLGEMIKIRGDTSIGSGTYVMLVHRDDGTTIYGEVLDDQGYLTGDAIEARKSDLIEVMPYASTGTEAIADVAPHEASEDVPWAQDQQTDRDVEDDTGTASEAVTDEIGTSETDDVDMKAPLPDVPTTDEAWQETILDARTSVTMQEDWSFETPVVNTRLLWLIRLSKLKNRDAYYSVFKKRKGVLGLAANLFRHRKVVQDVLPIINAKVEKRISKLVKDGKIDVKAKKFNGVKNDIIKRLKKQEKKLNIPGLFNPIKTGVKNWIKSSVNSERRIVLDAAGIHDLKGLVGMLFQERIGELVKELKPREDTVKKHLAEKAKAEPKKGKQARHDLWVALSQEAEHNGVFVEQKVRRVTTTMEDGASVTLSSTVANSKHMLNEEGYRYGGNIGYSADAVALAMERLDIKDPGRAGKMEKFLKTLATNEGKANSMNTWDSELVTAGAGLSGSGRLQRAMYRFKQEDPGKFHQVLGKFGVDIVKDGGEGNAYFTVRVPDDASMIPAKLTGKVTPGQFIKGSKSTGSGKTMDRFSDAPALYYIAHDPLLLTRFMYAGHFASYQAIILEESSGSLRRGEHLTLTIPPKSKEKNKKARTSDEPEPEAVAPIKVKWTDVMSGLDNEYLEATQAVAGYRYHASASTYQKLQKAVSQYYFDNIGQKAPEALTVDEKKQLARFLTSQLKDTKYGAYRKQFPGVAEELFPAG